MSATELRVRKWFGKRKELASIRTVCTHIKNMIKVYFILLKSPNLTNTAHFQGVTYGFQYKMRSVYAHFPINVSIKDDGGLVEVRNFLGEKFVRRVELPVGVKAQLSAKQKDEVG